MTSRLTIPASTNNYHQGRIGGVIRYIVIHDGETQKVDSADEGMGYWFQNPSAQASAHKGVDADSICTYVQDQDTAWGAPYVNADGLHLEQAGRASESAADWSDDFSKAVIANAAIVIAEWSHEHGIPLRPMTDAQLAARNYAGVITHMQASRVFLPGGHTDPGAAYPLASLLAQGNALLGTPAPTTAPVALPRVAVVPAKIWLKVDGQLGRATRARVQQFVGAAIDGIWGPATTLAVQAHFGAKQDGLWGPGTWAAIQRAIGARPDGIPGPITITLLQRYLNGK